MHKTRTMASVALAAMLVAACGSSTSSGGTANSAVPTSDAAASTAAPTSDAAADTVAPPVSASTSEADSAVSTASSAATEASGEPIKIGFTNVDSGPAGFPGFTKGAELAVKYANEQLGGVGGRPLELVSCSQVGDEASATTCGQKLANDSSLTAIMTGFQFFGGPFYAATAAKNRTVVGTIPLTAADFGAQGVWFWGSGSLGQLTAEAIYAVTNLQAKNIGLVYLDNPAGQQGAQLVDQVITASGAASTAVPVPQGSSDFAPAITAAGGSNVDAFLLLVDGTGCIGVANALSQLGLDTPVVGSSSCQGQSVLDAVGDKMEGWYFGEAGPTPLLGKGVDASVDEYLAAFDAYGGPTSPTQDYAYQSFGYILAIRTVMQSIGVDKLTPQTFDAAVQTFTGPVPMGSPSLTCPGKTIPSVCSSAAYIYQFKNKAAIDILGGKPIVAG